SMDKIIPDGSLIAVKPVGLTELKNGDIVVFSNGYEYSVKRYYKHDDKLVFRPESSNLAHYDQTYSIIYSITTKKIRCQISPLFYNVPLFNLRCISLTIGDGLEILPSTGVFIFF